MSLITRCGLCQTAFRITPEQLQAHGGQVRCGRCLQIFDGLAALVPEMPVETPQPAMSQPVMSPPEMPQPEPPAATVVPQEAMVEAEPSPTSAWSPDNPFADAPAALALGTQRRPRLIAACVALLLALAAQGVYFYRGEIAARQPLARQWLSVACAQVGCTVPLPQQPQAIVIEASDLQTLDPARPDRIQLTATLRNHAGHDLAYPALDLVLTNTQDHTLARRIFLPAEYLGAGRDPRVGLTANAELTVRLALETDDLGAAGFRLTLLSAPRR